MAMCIYVAINCRCRDLEYVNISPTVFVVLKINYGMDRITMPYQMNSNRSLRYVIDHLIQESPSEFNF